MQLKHLRKPACATMLPGSPPSEALQQPHVKLGGDHIFPLTMTRLGGGRARLLALSVRTLARKLAQILSLPFELFCLSSRKGHVSPSSLGFRAVWSGSPPPSPTFAVSCKHCNPCERAFSLTGDLATRIGEVVCERKGVCVIDVSRRAVCIITCYGHPVSHVDRRANESYLRDLFSVAGMMTWAT